MAETLPQSLTRPIATTTPQVTAEIVNYSFPIGINIRRLSGGDFTLDSSVLIGLKYKDCMLVLFYTQNEESIKLLRMWSRLAASVAGPLFATCNVLVEDSVARAFASVKTDGNHPLHVYGLHQWPVIMAYRGGFPQAVFNGTKSDQSIANWGTTMACNARYFEPMQIHGGINLDNKGEIIPSPEPYIENRVKISSSDFDNNPEGEVRRISGTVGTGGSTGRPVVTSQPQPSNLPRPGVPLPVQ